MTKDPSREGPEPVPVKGRLRDAVIEARGAPMEAKAVLHVLIHHVDTVTLTCWPAIPTIAREVGCNEDTARKWLGILAAANILRRFTRTKENGANDSPGWVIIEDQLQARLEAIPRSARGSILPGRKDQTPSETSDGPGRKDPTAPVGKIQPPPSERSDTNPVKEPCQGTPSENTVRAPAKPPVDFDDLWAALTAFTPKPGAWKLTPERRKHLAARVADHGEAAVYRVAEWVRTSPHDRAVFLRDRGDVSTLLRPEKFATYAAFSDGPQRGRPANAPRPAPGAPPGRLHALDLLDQALLNLGE